MSAGPPRIFDSQAYRRRRGRAASLGGDIFLAQDVAGHLAERLGAINRHFGRGLDLHSRAAVFPTLQPFADSWVRTGFALPVADVERTIIRYRDLSRLFGDLRALGETNVLVGRRSGFLSRRMLQAVTAEYASRFADAEGRMKATFDIVFLTGWAPHE